MAQYADLSDMTSEAGVIATIICEPDMLNYSDNLDGSCFTDTTNGVLYECIKALHMKGIEQIDSFNMIAELGSNDALRSIAKESITSEFVDSIVSNAKYIARGTSEEFLSIVNNVSMMAYRRKLYSELNKAQKDCLNVRTDIITLQNRVYDKIEEVSSKYVIGADTPFMGDLVDELWNSFLQKQDGGANVGIKTRFKSLNELVTYEKGQLVLYAGAMKSGKSMLVMNEAIDAAMRGIPTFIYDTEMDDELYFLRMVCYLSQVKMSVLKSGRYTEEENVRIEKAKAIIRKIPLTHKYSPITDPTTVYTTVKTMHKKGKCDFLCYDYIKDNDGKDASQVFYSLGTLTNLLKNTIAGGLNIPVLSDVQLNRTGQVAESLKISQFASAVIKIAKKSMDEIECDGKECGNYRITVVANRLGGQHDPEVEWVDASFYGDYCTFEEAEKQHSSEDIFG